VTLDDWASRWGVHPAALVELRMEFMAEAPAQTVKRKSGEEGQVSNDVRLEIASECDGRLFRNNVGAGYMKDGSFIRFGLANESKKMNETFKSSDLIGLKPVLITTEMVGTTIGQFVARESKRPGWVYRGTPREVGQLNFLKFVLTKGGDAAFVTGKGSF